jgi:hypothetical protein
MRSASDRALMMILTAVMGHKDPNAEQEVAVGPDGKPLTSEQQTAADQRAFRKLLGQSVEQDENNLDQQHGTEEGKTNSGGGLSTMQLSQRRGAHGQNNLHGGGTGM